MPHTSVLVAAYAYTGTQLASAHIVTCANTLAAELVVEQLNTGVYVQQNSVDQLADAFRKFYGTTAIVVYMKKDKNDGQTT